ncbi:hypothetical protein TREES_T100016269 [Tupaia chinensis]|uniref:Uncharacterized protein n=1 Tax=Tupaia chinensis TaxID=246437 RepID=L9JED2_TUPCH|nr:hypothetical protein TREES_T100016269 [Tupaia chinensis]
MGSILQELALHLLTNFREQGRCGVHESMGSLTIYSNLDRMRGGLDLDWKCSLLSHLCREGLREPEEQLELRVVWRLPGQLDAKGELEPLLGAGAEQRVEIARGVPTDTSDGIQETSLPPVSKV